MIIYFLPIFSPYGTGEGVNKLRQKEINDDKLYDYKIKMKATAVSRTAQYIAFFRAIETNQPTKKRLFDDELASEFLDIGLKLAVKITAMPVIGNIIINYIQKRGLGALSASIARTKYIDDLLKKAIDGGAKQVIILGAGFDTRAMRLPFLKDMPVIEIDHPNTSDYKLDIFKKSNIKSPSNISYLQIDFNKQGLSEFSFQRNINFSLPTVIIWEGVTSYLSSEAIDKSFEFFQKFASGSSIIFTYLHRLALDDSNAFKGVAQMKELLKSKEENWTFGFYPEQLPNYLQTYGLTLYEDNGAVEYRKMYMPERKNLLNGFEFHRIAFVGKK